MANNNVFDSIDNSPPENDNILSGEGVGVDNSINEPPTPREQSEEETNVKSSNFSSKKRKRKNKTRRRKSSESSSSEESDESSDDEPVKKRFKIVSEEEKHRWQLPKSMAKYCNNHMNSYIPEKDIKENILEMCPIPNNIQNCKTLDDFVKVLVSEKVKKDDEMLEKCQQRILQTMGPLGRLWNDLNTIKETPQEEQVIDIDKLVTCADQAVMILGQAINVINYNRRFTILNAIVKDTRDVKKLLKEKQEIMQQSKSVSDLFGKSFRKHLEELVKVRKKTKETFQQISSPKTSQKKPFQRGGPPNSAQNNGGRKLKVFSSYRDQRLSRPQQQWQKFNERQKNFNVKDYGFQRR